ncbi:hypothetical protein BDZ45DRAFT_750265 [Acephala macrosclerotiorum]|nr:hypothetical protein BDZ45DRAFT_750265 [Acephala macrosclerotiorum]
MSSTSTSPPPCRLLVHLVTELALFMLVLVLFPSAEIMLVLFLFQGEDITTAIAFPLGPDLVILAQHLFSACELLNHRPQELLELPSKVDITKTLAVGEKFKAKLGLEQLQRDCIQLRNPPKSSESLPALCVWPYPSRKRFQRKYSSYNIFKPRAMYAAPEIRQAEGDAPQQDYVTLLATPIIVAPRPSTLHVRACGTSSHIRSVERQSAFFSASLGSAQSINDELPLLSRFQTLDAYTVLRCFFPPMDINSRRNFPHFRSARIGFDLPANFRSISATYDSQRLPSLTSTGFGVVIMGSYQQSIPSRKSRSFDKLSNTPITISSKPMSTFSHIP